MEGKIPFVLALLALVLALGYIRYSNDRIKALLAEGESGLGYETDAAIPEPVQIISFSLPDSLSFAGEPVPMHLPDIRERLDKELHINSYLHNNTIFLMKRANRWFPQMVPILKQYGIPEDFKYLPLIESALLNDVSPKQAVGFWQIIKSAGRENGLEINPEVDERYDPLKSTEAACTYLRKAYERFGNWTLVAASYNRGISGMNKALDNQQVQSYYDLFLNDETSRYVFRILACKEIIEHPQTYGFTVDPSHLYQPEVLRYVEVDKTIPDLVMFAKAQGSNYKLLKRHNPWLRDDRLTVRNGKTYRIAFPE
jgi:hypothetical protein